MFGLIILVFVFAFVNADTFGYGNSLLAQLIARVRGELAKRKDDEDLQ